MKDLNAFMNEYETREMQRPQNSMEPMNSNRHKDINSNNNIIFKVLIEDFNFSPNDIDKLAYKIEKRSRL